MTSAEMEKLMLDKLVYGLIEKTVERLEALKPWENENYIQPATMKRQEAARYIGISPMTLDKLDIPKVHPNGVGYGRIVLYRKETIDEWLREKEIEDNKTTEEFLKGEFDEDDLKVS